MNSKMTFETRYGKYEIETGDMSDKNLGVVVEYLVKPLMLAAGYQPSSVNEYLGECVCDEPPPNRE